MPVDLARRSAADMSTRLITDWTSLKLGTLYVHHVENLAMNYVR